MSKMQRTKGASGEREFCRLLSEHLGEPVARNLLQTRDGGAGGDVAVGPWAIEVKRAAKPELNTWWAQAVAQAGAEKIPVLAYRLDFRDWRVRLPIHAIDPEGELWSNCPPTPEWCVEISLTAFAAIAREQLDFA